MITNVSLNDLLRQHPIDEGSELLKCDLTAHLLLEVTLVRLDAVRGDTIVLPVDARVEAAIVPPPQCQAVHLTVEPLSLDNRAALVDAAADAMRLLRLRVPHALVSIRAVSPGCILDGPIK